MKRVDAREAVYGTLFKFDIAPGVVTRETKLRAVVQMDVRRDFVRELNAKLPVERNLDVSHVAVFTVGQVVAMAQLPGTDSTPGRRRPPQPREEPERSEPS